MKSEYIRKYYELNYNENTTYWIWEMQLKHPIRGKLELSMFVLEKMKWIKSITKV